MMKLTQTNPYHIIGILANASARDIQSRKGKIQAFARVGKEITSEYDFSFLKQIDRNEEAINQAFSKIEQNQEKIIHSLFWFINANTFDETAINYLKNGNKEKAIEIWKKITFGKEVNSKNFSAFNNIGTLYLSGQSDEEIKQGIEAKIKLIESESFKELVHLVADETFFIDQNKQVEILIDALLSELKNDYSSEEIRILLFGECSKHTQEYISTKFAKEHIYKIEAQIEKAKNKRIENKGNAFMFGEDLYKNCKDELALLKSILGTENLQYKVLSDNLAKEIMQCGIDYFKEWQDSKDPSKESLGLLNKALSFATNQQIKDRIIDNIEGIQEFAKTEPVKEEINFITNKLLDFQNLNDSVQNAKDLVNSCRPKLQKIRIIKGSSDEFYLKISGMVVNNTLGMLIEVINEEQKILQYFNSDNPDIDELKKIALKRYKDASSTEDALVRLIMSYRDFNYDGLTIKQTLPKTISFSKFKEVVSEGLKVSNMLSAFDMSSEIKSHYNRNHSTLKSIASKLGVSSNSSNTVSSTSKTSSSDSPNTYQPTTNPQSQSTFNFATNFWWIGGIVWSIIMLLGGESVGSAFLGGLGFMLVIGVFRWLSTINK